MDLYTSYVLAGLRIKTIIFFTRNFGIRKLMYNLKDYTLRYVTGEIYEEDDGGGIISLFNNIEICIYCFEFYMKNYGTTFETTLTLDEYVNHLKELYILKKDGTKITLDKFIPFIYQKGNYGMIGDSIFR